MGCAGSKPEVTEAASVAAPAQTTKAAQGQQGPAGATSAAAIAGDGKAAAQQQGEKTSGSDSSSPTMASAEAGAAPAAAPAAPEVQQSLQQAAGTPEKPPAALDGPAASGTAAPPPSAPAAQEQQQQAPDARAAASAPATLPVPQPTAAPALPPPQQQQQQEEGAGAASAATDATAANGQPHNSLSTTSSGTTATTLTPGMGTWDKAKMLFSLMRPEELFNDLHDLKYIGAGGYGKVFKAVWRSAPVAVKLVPSHSPELFKSSSYKEALLCKELCHPNIVQTYETRCAQLTEEFVHSILSATTPPGQSNSGLHMSGNGVANTTSYGSQEFVSGDGFGLPSPVPDMLVRGKTLSEAAAKWKDILFTTGAKGGDYLTVIIMDFCDYGSLVRPIVKGMFRPFSASGSDREARVRYRALLRTAKEIAQGLEHLHYLRVVHGDLKPGNVLLKGSRVDVRGFNAQVIDFGLSHMVNNSNPQRVSKAGGTLVYAAPEVFSGVVGKAADVYSLGIILWEMVTGSQPYKDLNEGEIVLGVQKHGLRPTWPPGHLPQLQELYEKCVAQDLEARPKAKDVVQFLTQIEMDLRAELRAAHKRQQQAQALQAIQQQQQAVNGTNGNGTDGGAAGAGGGAGVGGQQPDQGQLLAAHQQAMAAVQQQQQQQQQQQAQVR